MIRWPLELDAHIREVTGEGDVSPINKERMWEKIEPVPFSGCWIWMGTIKRNGYGIVIVHGKYMGAHRHSYILHKGPIPDGLQLDHKCRVRCCVNPDHLEPVTAQENARRGNQGALEKARTHCPYGHPYDEENTYYQLRANGVTKRVCRACGRARYHRLRVGPEDEFDDETNGDPDSLVGEEDERGFDDMPIESGWDDGDFEFDEEDEEGEDDE